MPKVGIFGGTFNPPHLGHRNIAEGFLERCDLDEMLIIPSYTPPHKEAKDLASGEERLAMCEMTFRGLPANVDAIELERKGTSYTVDTLRLLKERYGEDGELYFLMGDDMLLYLDKWVRPHEILELATVVSAVRSTSCTLSTLEGYAKNTFPEEYASGRFLFYEIPPFPVSSTEVRENLGEGRSVTGLVAPDVERYIKDRGLYHDRAERTVYGTEGTVC